LDSGQNIYLTNYRNAAILGQIGFVMAGTAHVPYRISCNEDCLHQRYSYSVGSGQYNAVAAFFDALQQAKLLLAEKKKNRMDAFRQQHPSATTVPNSVAYSYLQLNNVMACIQI
jgi:hypothetical protein